MRRTTKKLAENPAMSDKQRDIDEVANFMRTEGPWR